MLKAFQRTLSSRFKSGGESKEDSSMVISTSDRGGPLGFKLDRPSLNDFEVGETLGTGTFGRCRMVKLKASGAYYALKISKKSEIISKKQVEHVRNEVSLLGRIDHPNVVNMIGVFQDSRRLYLVMEFVQGGELFSHLRSAGRFPDPQAKLYSAEVVDAFCYMHDMNMIYRDLKPENLLISREGRIKIADFGFAKVVEDRTWTLCGTPEYLAPEIIQSQGHGKSVDWWALGILIYEMLAGYPPFNDESSLGIYQKILIGRFEVPRHIDSKAKDLIKQLVVLDRTKRLGCVKGGGSAVKQHQWFAGIDWADLVMGRLQPPFLPKLSGKGDSHYFEQYPDSPVDTSRALSAKEQELFAGIEKF